MRWREFENHWMSEEDFICDFCRDREWPPRFALVIDQDDDTYMALLACSRCREGERFKRLAGFTALTEDWVKIWDWRFFPPPGKQSMLEGFL